jgi:hypothetical protein
MHRAAARSAALPPLRGPSDTATPA